MPRAGDAHYIRFLFSSIEAQMISEDGQGALNLGDEERGALRRP